MDEVAEARKALESFTISRDLDSCVGVDRDLLVAYATLFAWTSHFPARALARDHELLILTDVIFQCEPDRFYKQRRIALGRLAQTLGSSKCEF